MKTLEQLVSEAAPVDLVKAYAEAGNDWQKRYAALRLILKWGYSPERAAEYGAHEDGCTDKQARYIEVLSEQQPELALELECLVNLFEREGCGSALSACSKGQAMFVIKCFLGQIEPRRWIPDDAWCPWC